MSEKENENKKNFYKLITRKYNQISSEFNLVALKGRYKLREMNALIEEEEKFNEANNKKKNNSKKSDNRKTEIKRKCLNKSASEITLKKLRDYHRWQISEMFKEKGVDKYIKSMLKNSNLVKTSSYCLQEKLTAKNGFKTKTDTQGINELYKNFNLIPINERVSSQREKSNELKINRSPIYNRLLTIKRLKTTRHNSERDKFFLNRPLSPFTKNNGMKVTSRGGGLIWPYSLFRNKSINDFVPYFETNSVSKILNEFKAKRYDVIYNKKPFTPIDQFFVSGFQYNF